MKDEIIARNGKIFLETPEFLTIRALVPVFGAADFVLCRKDGQYSDCRHPDKVEIGDIYDDLARRDFTVNAIAMDEQGNYIDPHNGITDLNNKLLRAVGNAHDRFTEDALRLVRAVRFAITKAFKLHPSIEKCLHDQTLINLLSFISTERIREELLKCFKHNTLETLFLLNKFIVLQRQLFYKTAVWLKPTMEEV